MPLLSRFRPHAPFLSVHSIPVSLIELKFARMLRICSGHGNLDKQRACDWMLYTQSRIARTPYHQNAVSPERRIVKLHLNTSVTTA